MKILLLLMASVVASVSALDPDRSDYEGKSEALTTQLLKQNLGYVVLNNEILRKNLGYSISGSVEAEERNDEAVEDLPTASALVQDRDFEVHHNSDDKFWGSGPSPFFFDFFGSRPISSSAVRPFRPLPPPRNPHPVPHLAPKAFVGDQHQCAAGSCEFFLFCWLSGGIVDGPCGGFLFACCQRPDAGGRNSEIIAYEVSFFWTK